MPVVYINSCSQMHIPTTKTHLINFYAIGVGYSPLILALGRKRQEDLYVFEAGLVYTVSFRPLGAI